ncbi:hypothetical protein R3P38DRAFT_3484724 [Favolaschia claudopus]|uniref:Uncharacterized protein n=1 Tax=Favolaschia claudopus TaxID=2862362 RepID=A0AAW0CB18_9AGAR
MTCQSVSTRGCAMTVGENENGDEKGGNVVHGRKRHEKHQRRCRKLEVEREIEEKDPHLERRSQTRAVRWKWEEEGGWWWFGIKKDFKTMSRPKGAAETWLRRPSARLRASVGVLRAVPWRSCKPRCGRQVQSRERDCQCRRGGNPMRGTDGETEIALNDKRQSSQAYVHKLDGAQQSGDRSVAIHTGHSETGTMSIDAAVGLVERGVRIIGVVMRSGAGGVIDKREVSKGAFCHSTDRVDSRGVLRSKHRLLVGVNVNASDVGGGGRGEVIVSSRR